MEPIENKIVQETRFEQVGVPMQQTQFGQQQQTVVPTTETNITATRELPPIVETIIEQPVYKQVIIEQHQIPVQTVFTQAQPMVANQVTQLQTGEIQPHQDHIRVVRQGYRKSVWGLSFAGELYQMNRDRKLGIMWEKFPYWQGAGTFRFHDFSVIKKGFLYLIGEEDRQLYYLDPTHRHEGMLTTVMQQGTTLPRLKSVSAYGIGQAYLLAEDGSVHHFDNGRIFRVNGNLRSLSCGQPGRNLFSRHGFEMWGVDQNGMAMRWNGVDSWVNLMLPVRDVQVGRDNSVFAIDQAGQLIRWNDKMHQFSALPPTHAKFKDMGGNMPMEFFGVSVFKEKRGIYCVDRHGNVYSME
jgi:hypothetical protein